MRPDIERGQRSAHQIKVWWALQPIRSLDAEALLFVFRLGSRRLGLERG